MNAIHSTFYWVVRTVGSNGAIAPCLAMVCAAIAAFALEPRSIIEAIPPKLESVIPRSFGGWSAGQDPAQQVSLFAVDENGNNPTEAAYDDSLLRTYIRADGRQIMLAIAYDHVQREEDRVHRPEICYIAQGFTILSDEEATFHLVGRRNQVIEGRRMLTRNGKRLEAVSYWIRVGDTFTQNPWRSRIYVIEEGLLGKLHDGVLLRTSEIIARPEDAANSFKRQEAFLSEFIGDMPNQAATLLANSSIAAAPPGIAAEAR